MIYGRETVPESAAAHTVADYTSDLHGFDCVIKMHLMLASLSSHTTTEAYNFSVTLTTVISDVLLRLKSDLS